MSGARGESARCPRTVTLPAESAAGPGGATPSRGRSGPLTRRRPPGAIPPAPLKRKHSPTRGGSLERISRAARRRGAAGKIPAFERERARFGSGFGFGFGFGFDARWNRPTRRETKADRETRHPKRRRRRSQTRGETRRVHLYFCNAGEKRRARSSSSRRARRRRVRTRASECDRADHIHPP